MCFDSFRHYSPFWVFCTPRRVKSDEKCQTPYLFEVGNTKVENVFLFRRRASAEETHGISDQKVPPNRQNITFLIKNELLD